MKLLCFSDLHFLSAPSGLAWCSDRLEYQLATCRWFAQQIRRRQPDVVVNLGDSNHVHGSISMAALQAFGRGMSEVYAACSEVSAQFYVMAGNHDQATKDGSVNFVDSLLPSGIKLVTAGASWFTAADGDSLGLIPHTADPGRFLDLVGQAGRQSKSRMDFLIHQDVRDVLWGPGRPATVGVEMGQLASWRTSDSWVLCGHYHHPQLFASERFAVVGSPFYPSWADSVVSLPRGYLWLNTRQRNRPRWEANPYTPIRHTLSVRQSKDALEWVVGAEARYRGLDLSRLMLRVVCPTTKVARNVQRKLQDRGLLRLLVTTPAQKQEIEVEQALVEGVPEQAVRDYVAQLGGVTVGVTTADLLDAGMVALRGGVDLEGTMDGT